MAKSEISFLKKAVNVFVLRAEALPGAAAPSVLPQSSAGPMPEPARWTVLVGSAAEAVAAGQPSPPTVHPVWTFTA